MTKDEQKIMCAIASGTTSPLKTKKMVAILDDKSKTVETKSALTNVSGAMACLGDISRTELWKLRRRGLPFYKIGARVVFHPDEIVEWVRKNNKEA